MIRPAFPDQLDVIRAWIEQYLSELHTSFPGRIESYDAATQTANVQPLIRHPVLQPDGSYAYEDLPVLPSIPVMFPRSEGWFVACRLGPGDTVLVVCCETAIGHWRDGDGAAQYPGDLRRHHIAHAVAIPGLFVHRKALAHAPQEPPPDNATPEQVMADASAPAVVLGSDDPNGTRVTIRKNGAVEVTQGDTRVVTVETDGTVHLGGDTASNFLALANLVNARLDTIQSTFDGHTHGPGGSTGGYSSSSSGGPISGNSGAPNTIIGSLGDVAASKAKAT